MTDNKLNQSEMKKKKNENKKKKIHSRRSFLEVFILNGNPWMEWNKITKIYLLI